MCSICGIVNYKKEAVQNAQIVHEMNKIMEHRGPDSSGTSCFQNVCLGHRRLSIIDMTGGIQPMTISYANNTFVIVYNGELYNTNEIRKQLKSYGHKLFTNSDTEVLLRAYIEWGIDCLKMFNGIFAFAIWDARKEELFCVRDHLGVKPFFYSVKDDDFIFSSEIKGILKHPFISPIIDETGLCELIGLSPARTPGIGCFKGVNELKRGHYLIYNRDGLSIKEYWNVKAIEHTENIEETIAHVRHMVEDSINRQLVSDVELGCFLSGGLDSSIISAIASNKYINEGRVLKTFSVDFEDNYKNFQPSVFQPDADSGWVNLVSDYIKSNHTNVVLSSESLKYYLYNGMCARDLPGMADIDTSLILFCKTVKEHVKVALSGECADEIFGGYPWYHNPGLYDRGLFPWGGNIQFRQSLVNKDISSNLHIYDYVQNSYDMCVNKAEFLDSDSEDEVSRKKMFMLNIDYFMANLLERKDRMSMACGLEVRVPFCDYKLVEYAYNIPWNIKAIDKREKGVLRRAAQGLLPNDVIQRKKSPYPKTFDPKYTKMIIDMFMSDILIKNDAPIYQIFDKKALINLCKPPYSSKPWFGQLMATPQLIAYLWQINAWLAEYKIHIVA